MASQDAINVLLNFIVNNAQAIKNINNLSSANAKNTKIVADNSVSIQNNSKVVNDNSSRVVNNTKVINDNRTVIINKTNALNSSTDSVLKNSSAYSGLQMVLTGITAALGAMTKQAISVGMEFETAMRNVNSIAKLSEEQFTRLSDSTREVAKMAGVKDTATGVAKAMYQVVSSGFEGARALEIAAVASKAASAGMTSTETAVYALTGLMNSYNKKTLPDAITFSNQLFTVVDKGVISFEQLATNLGSVLSFASTAGVTFEEVGAAFITLTKNNVNASESETAITNLIRTITDPDDGAIAAAEKMGIEWNAMGLEQKGLTGLMKELYEVTGGATDQIAKFIPESRAQKAALILTKNAGADYNEALGFMGKANEGLGSTQTALNEQMKATSFQIAKATALIEDLKIEFFNLSKNALQPLIQDFSFVIKFFLSLDTETKKTITTIILWTTAVGGLSLAFKALSFIFGGLIPLIVSMGGFLLKGVGTFLTFSNTIVKVANGVRFLIPLLRGVAGLFLPGGAFIVAVSAGVAAVLLLKRGISQIIEGYRALAAMAQKKMSWSDLDEGREKARDLIKEYYKLKNAKKEISAEDMRMYSKAFATRIAETTDPKTKERLKQEAISLSMNAKFKTAHEARIKAAKELEAQELKTAIRIKNAGGETTKNEVKKAKETKAEKVKAEEDYTQEIKNLREGLTDKIQKETQTELNYQLWKIDQEVKAQKASVQKAILRKQATEADLKKIDYAAKLEKDRITKEFADKEKKQADDLAKEIKKITQSELQNKIDAINEEFDAKKKLLQEGLKTNKSTNKDIINLEKQRQEAIAIIDKEAQDVKIKSLQETQKLIDSIYQQSADVETGGINLVLDSVGELGGIFTNISDSVKQAFGAISSFNSINSSLKERINLIQQDKNLTEDQKIELEGVAKATAEDAKQLEIATILMKVGLNAVNKLTEAFRMLKSNIDEGNMSLNDFLNVTDKILSAIGPLGDALAGIGRTIVEMFISKDLINFNPKKQAEDLKAIREKLTDENKKMTESELNYELYSLEKEKEETIKQIDDLTKYGEKGDQERAMAEVNYQKKRAEIMKKYAKPTEDKILDIRKGVIEKAFEAEKKAIEKIYEIKKSKSEKYIDIYNDEISRVKSGIKEIEDELFKREKTKAQSEETASAFKISKGAIAGSLTADFFRQPIDVFELQNEQAMQTLQMQFNTGMITLDAFNAELMNLSVKRNIFYQHISDSLVKGTKDQIDYQKKANDAFGDFAEAQQTATNNKLIAEKANLQSQLEGFESLKRTELQNIQDIEKAQITAIDNLTTKWQTPAGAFKLSMDEALMAVSDKMDLTLKNFINNAKEQIAELNANNSPTQASPDNKPVIGPLMQSGSFYAKPPSATKSIKDKPLKPLGFITDPINQMVDAFFRAFGGESQSGTDVQWQPITQENKNMLKSWQDWGEWGIKGFANGGVFDAPITGAPAMLHNSEMILNPMQQSNLFRMINAGGGGGINVTINTGPVSNQSDINKIASAVSNVIRRDYIRA